jgi:hypothetical protein
VEDLVIKFVDVVHGDEVVCRNITCLEPLLGGTLPIDIYCGIALEAMQAKANHGHTLKIAYNH